MAKYQSIAEIRARFYPGMIRLLELDRTELVKFRHSAKHCPYCREGRQCPHMEARRWRERMGSA